jgi:AraC family transcriptional regulator of adaptative response/methylated-DNA-[protein]-cysteine methyltransferase
VSILIGEHRKEIIQDLHQKFPRAHITHEDSDKDKLVARVVELIESPREGIGLPLDIGGTNFQKRVWKALLEIPPGETTTYTDIARKIGAPKAISSGRQCMFYQQSGHPDPMP